MTADDRTDEQKMLEKPVKGYQLRELTNAVSDLEKTVDTKLSEILNNTKGLATVTDVETVKQDLRKEFNERIDNEVKAIHLKYNPTYKGIWWVVSSVGGLLLATIWASFNNFWRGN